MEAQQKLRMNKQVKKSIIGKNKQGFTLLELTVSLFLLVILTLLLMLILQTTINTSKRFLDYSNYEYALAHRKILETYNKSAKVTQEKHYILMESKDDSEDVRINFIDNRIYIDKYKNSHNFAGFILLLKNLKEYNLSEENNIIHISLVDKNNHKHDMYLRVKNEKTDKEKAQEEKEKKDKDDKAKEEKEKQGKDKVEIEKIKPITHSEEGS